MARQTGVNGEGVACSFRLATARSNISFFFSFAWKGRRQLRKSFKFCMHQNNAKCNVNWDTVFKLDKWIIILGLFSIKLGPYIDSGRTRARSFGGDATQRNAACGGTEIELQKELCNHVAFLLFPPDNTRELFWYLYYLRWFHFEIGAICH